MAKGRPRKQGKRHPGGKLVQAVTYDKGSDWVQGQRDKYQTHYNTALGRAFAAGLLGEDQAVALDRYQGGKRFVRVYSRCIGGQAYRCALDRTPVGAESIEYADHERDRREHDWLHAAMNSMDDAGCRPYFDQLITRAHTDHGPPWLDRMLNGGKDPADAMVLKAAICALDILAPPRQASRIVSQHYEDAA